MTKQKTRTGNKRAISWIGVECVDTSVDTDYRAQVSREHEPKEGPTDVRKQFKDLNYRRKNCPRNAKGSQFFGQRDMQHAEYTILLECVECGRWVVGRPCNKQRVAVGYCCSNGKGFFGKQDCVLRTYANNIQF